MRFLGWLCAVTMNGVVGREVIIDKAMQLEQRSGGEGWKGPMGA